MCSPPVDPSVRGNGRPIRGIVGPVWSALHRLCEADPVRIPQALTVAAVVLTAGTAIALVAPSLPGGASPPSGTTLYREALATTAHWSVHYASAGTVSGVTILESGDAGPSSGTQNVLVGKGTATDSADLIVIGDLTYMKANARALVDLTGLSEAQATVNAGKWVQFATNNQAFAQVVVGIRSHDVTEELALKGPYTLGPSQTLDGLKVDAIHGTQRFQGLKPMRAILYVRAHGSHVPVEEDTVSASGVPNGVEHTIFSLWGEMVRPEAPPSAISIGPVGLT